METSTRVTLNVGGMRFTTTTDTLNTLPDTRLGQLAKDRSLTANQPDAELFFDRNPDLMNSLLDLYRTGELHLPKHLCIQTVERELRFWGIPLELIRECCYKVVEDHKADILIVKEIDQFLKCPFDTPEEIEKLSAWNRIWLLMERPSQSVGSKIWTAVFFIFVFISVLFYTFQTSMKFREFFPGFSEYFASINITEEDALASMNLLDEYRATQPHAWLNKAEVAIFAFFLVEFLVRFLTCPAKGYMIKQAKSCFDIFMLVHTAITFLLDYVLDGRTEFTSLEMNGLTFFYSLSVLRVLRILYLAKHFDSMKILLLSTRASLKELLLLTLCLMSLAAIFGAALYIVEILSEHYTFSSISYSFWYAIVTITTVGYGDVVPAGTIGRLLGILCALCGVIVMALPVAVIASKFSSYHDNIGSRRQIQTRVDFVKNNPRFCSVHDCEGNSEVECESGRGDKVEERSEEKDVRGDSGRGERGGSACCDPLKLLQQRRRRRKSHPILVLPQNSVSSDSGASCSSAVTTITDC